MRAGAGCFVSLIPSAHRSDPPDGARADRGLRRLFGAWRARRTARAASAGAEYDDGLAVGRD